MATLLHDTITLVGAAADVPSKAVDLSDGVFIGYLETGGSAPDPAARIVIQKEDPFNGQMDDVFTFTAGKVISTRYPFTYRIPCAGKYWILAGGNEGADVTCRAYVEQIM